MIYKSLFCLMEAEDCTRYDKSMQNCIKIDKNYLSFLALTSIISSGKQKPSGVGGTHMINTDAFSYINILDKAADASWTRSECINNNLANVDTPGYKRQDIDFSSVLAEELGHYKYVSLDQKVRNLNLNHLNASVYTDYANYSYREDRNNVDIDTEEVERASETIKYQTLTDSISQEFSRLKTAMS